MATACTFTSSLSSSFHSNTCKHHANSKPFTLPQQLSHGRNALHISLAASGNGRLRPSSHSRFPAHLTCNFFIGDKILLPRTIHLSKRNAPVANANAALKVQQVIKPEEVVKVVTPMVKMCGITSPEDAAMAARAGANYVGMIVWPKSKRSVSVSLAREIAAAARENGAEPVGVFVDENAAEIESVCDGAGLSIAQLHGDRSRSSLMEGLSSTLKIIYVLHANKNGILQTPLPEEKGSPVVDWVLVDGLQGGSGEKFDWTNFQTPSMRSKGGWLLAGGLTPDNVALAVSLVRPDAVDVSSGIAGPDGICKDPARMKEFIKAVQSQSLTAL